MEMAIKLGKPVNPTNFTSVSAVNTAATHHLLSSATEIGLDYVSCSPFRVPIARLAAAQAKINEEN